MSRCDAVWAINLIAALSARSLARALATLLDLFIVSMCLVCEPQRASAAREEGLLNTRLRPRHDLWTA